MAPPLDLSRALKRAIALRACVDLIRHHPGLDLRLMETHPGGGAYDALSVVHWPSEEALCTLNVAGSGLLLGEPIGPVREAHGPLDRYPILGLSRDRTALSRAIADRLGLAPWMESPPTTPTTVTLSVLAVLLERVALGERTVDLRQGWESSSGLVIDPVRPWARALPGIHEHSAGDPGALRRSCLRWWAVDRRSAAPEPAAIFNVATSGWWVRGRERVPLAASFSRGSGIRALAWEVEQALDG